MWTAAAVTFGSMFIVMAAVTVVTAAIAQFIASLYLPAVNHWPLTAWCAVTIGLCLAVLLVGRYRVLERTMKIVMAALLLSTVAAVAVAAFGNHGTPAAIPVDAPAWWGAANFAFLLAFMGWMPIPIDSAIWNSIWVREHGRARGRAMTLREAILDYRTGYVTASVVAVLFLALGALMMYGRGLTFPDKGDEFVKQLIEIYGATLGRWSVPIISVAALTTMFSTTLVVLDAFPRAMHRLTQAVRGVPADESRGRSAYVGWVIAQAVAAMLILAFLSKGMKSMIDLATTLSFLTAPVLAVINYLVITRLVPVEARPGRAMRVLSVASIGFLALFGIAYFGWLTGRH